MKNNNKIVSIILLIVYFIFGVMAFPNKETVNNFNTLYYIVSAIFTLTFILFFTKDELKKEFKKFNKNIKKNLLFCFAIFISMFLIVTLSNFLIDILFGWNNINTDTLIFPNIKPMLLYTIFVLLIYTPFTEGIIFTKILKNIIKNKILWILISGILFGILQTGFDIFSFSSLIFSLPYIFIGILVSFIYEEKKNVFYPIFIWFFYYLFQFFVQYMAL